MSRTFNSANVGVNENYLHTPASGVYANLTAFTFAAWVYPTGLGGLNEGVILAQDPTGVYSPAFYFDGAGGSALFASITGAVNGISDTNEQLALNTWSHVTVTFDLAGDALLHVYINGVEATYSIQQAAVGPLADNSADGFYFGNDTFDFGWDGSLAEMAVWDRALTATEVASLAASTTGIPAALATEVGYWHFCGFNSPEPDASGNGNSAALSTNAPAAGSNSPGYTCVSFTVPQPHAPTLTAVAAKQWTVTDQEMMSIIQLAMLEPDDSGATWPSGMWTKAEVVEYLNEAQWDFLGKTGITAAVSYQVALAAQARFNLPSNVIDLRRVAWREGAYGTDFEELTRVNTWELDYGTDKWGQQTNPVPTAYLLDQVPSLTLQVQPVAGDLGALELTYTSLATSFDGTGVATSVPDDWTPYLVWGAKAKMLSKQGEANDPVRAAYCEQRYQEGVELGRLLVQGVR
jgi:hypothetical protein